MKIYKCDWNRNKSQIYNNEIDIDYAETAAVVKWSEMNSLNNNNILRKPPKKVIMKNDAPTVLKHSGFLVNASSDSV